MSQDPSNYKDAPTEGIRRVLETVTGQKIPRGEVLKTGKIGKPVHFLNPYEHDRWLNLDYIRLSTTVATNALLERKGEKHALVITKGFKVHISFHSYYDLTLNDECHM